MPKIQYFLVFLFLLASCKQEVSEMETKEESNFGTMADNLPKTVNVNTKAKAVLDKWNEYGSFDKSFTRVYTIDYREDLVLVIDDLVEKQNLLEKGEYPEEFNIPQIKGRQKVVKTYILKTKGNLEYRQNPEDSIKEMIKAYNALRKQFNVTVNSTLPTELIDNNKDI